MKGKQPSSGKPINTFKETTSKHITKVEPLDLWMDIPTEEYRKQISFLLHRQVNQVYVHWDSLEELKQELWHDVKWAANGSAIRTAWAAEFLSGTPGCPLYAFLIKDDKSGILNHLTLSQQMEMDCFNHPHRSPKASQGLYAMWQLAEATANTWYGRTHD